MLPYSFRFHILILSIVIVSGFTQAYAEPPKIGIVIMHGKGGTPTRHVDRLASILSDGGYLVENLEMPWSKNRDYGSSVSTAESQITNAIHSMRTRGATHIFVSGHSMGAGFALYYAGIHAIDGVIGLAPGGSVGSKKFKKKLGKSVAKAKKLIANDKGDTTTRLTDFEGSKGTYPIIVTPNNYLSWFDPKGAMNIVKSAKNINSDVAVLWAVAKRDYPGLRKFGPRLFNNHLSGQPYATYYEPDSDHKGAPSASIDEVKRWIAEVVVGS